MGYAYYVLPDGREAGYGVAAECDLEGCTARIDRGMGYLCGEMPDGHRGDNEPGCGRYFCADHDAGHNCPNPNGWDGDGNQKPYIGLDYIARMWAKAQGVPDPDGVVRVVAPIGGPARFEYADSRPPFVADTGADMDTERA